MRELQLKYGLITLLKVPIISLILKLIHFSLFIHYKNLAFKLLKKATLLCLMLKLFVTKKRECIFILKTNNFVVRVWLFKIVMATIKLSKKNLILSITLEYYITSMNMYIYPCSVSFIRASLLWICHPCSYFQRKCFKQRVALCLGLQIKMLPLSWKN